MKDPYFEAPDRSLAFFSRNPARAETSMGIWASIGLLLVLAALAFGGMP